MDLRAVTKVDLESQHNVSNDVRLRLGSVGARGLSPPGVFQRVWTEDTIGFCIAHETNDQVSSRVKEFPVPGYHRARASVIPYIVKELVGEKARVGMSQSEPKAVRAKRSFVVRVVR